jgi:hypothetical protein
MMLISICAGYCRRVMIVHVFFSFRLFVYINAVNKWVNKRVFVLIINKSTVICPCSYVTVVSQKFMKRSISESDYKN